MLAASGAARGSRCGARPAWVASASTRERAGGHLCALVGPVRSKTAPVLLLRFGARRRRLFSGHNRVREEAEGSALRWHLRVRFACGHQQPLRIVSATRAPSQNLTRGSHAGQLAGASALRRARAAACDVRGARHNLAQVRRQGEFRPPRHGQHDRSHSAVPGPVGHCPRVVHGRDVGDLGEPTIPAAPRPTSAAGRRAATGCASRPPSPLAGPPPFAPRRSLGSRAGSPIHKPTKTRLPTLGRGWCKRTGSGPWTR